MSVIDDLIADLESSVGGRALSYNAKSAAWDIYEGYVFGLIIRAAWAAGGSVSYQDIDGQSVNALLFRTSPGMLFSRAHPYTHAVIEFPACDPIEAHVGVRVQGRSGVLHECDVLVLPSDEANLSRSKQVAPRGSRSVLAVECKYYATHLSLHLARGFHGLHADLSMKHPFFVANLRAPRIERFLSYHNRSWENGVLPGTPQSDYFEGLVRDAFKRHQATRGALAP